MLEKPTHLMVDSDSLTELWAKCCGEKALRLEHLLQLLNVTHTMSD